MVEGLPQCQRRIPCMKRVFDCCRPSGQAWGDGAGAQRCCSKAPEMCDGAAMLGRPWRAIYLFLLHFTLVQAAEPACGLTTLPDTSAARGRTEGFSYENRHEWPCNGCERFPSKEQSKAVLASRGPKDPYM